MSKSVLKYLGPSMKLVPHTYSALPPIVTNTQTTLRSSSSVCAPCTPPCISQLCALAHDFFFLGEIPFLPSVSRSILLRSNAVYSVEPPQVSPPEMTLSLFFIWAHSMGISHLPHSFWGQGAKGTINQPRGHLYS